jgi:hypothetical protein
MIRIGCCITPHGFGHAARACAVMEALSEQYRVCFDIVTTVPEWFFADSLTASYILHAINCDIGLVQRNSLTEDLGRTIDALDRFYPLDRNLVDRVAAIFRGSSLVICDIAPLGIAAARMAGVASVLVENFTWDWIYRSYLRQWPGFAPHISYLQQLYREADYHLQTTPVCRPMQCDGSTAPVSRPRRQSRAVIREQLQVAETDTLVLVTMGGVQGTELPLKRLAAMEQCFILPGQSGEKMIFRGNLRLLPPDSGIYHPDLVAACDAVIGKVGYSTLAEVYQAGVPFAYIKRPGFRESSSLAAFINREMVSIEISREQFQSNRWLECIPELCRLVPDGAVKENGARNAAAFLGTLLDRLSINS